VQTAGGNAYEISEPETNITLQENKKYLANMVLLGTVVKYRCIASLTSKVLSFLLLI
jgi:hypothetical protein